MNNIGKSVLVPIILLLFLVLGNKAESQEQPSLRVLFVGNSFTYFFNLPQVVASMAETQGVTIETRQSTVGGSNLEQHWKAERGTRTRELLENEQWDFVVFNNHSLSAIDTPEEFMTYGKNFAELVKKKGAKPVFMMTWAYKSNPLMQEAITKGYIELSEKTGSEYVPGGLLFAKARKFRPNLELFHDDKHPSSNGTYLLGLAFTKFFTGMATKDIPARITTIDANGEKLYLLFMKQSDADFLRSLVDEFEVD